MNLSNKDLKTIEWKTVAEKQLVSDLREARKIIGEMRNIISELSSRIYDISMFPKDEIVANEAEAILEKAKEWV